ncbi:MAG: tryptophan synthase subunit alpha [Actinobacteria bacterium]|uniref:tryptophan synthase n=1 Tax=freshwater metagenome TaxID=449393 RepID=A0A6J7EAS0_9ZZZZ|nr:tryptophan synthase subunit alpha [Actinomycetota bacterium]
MSSRLDELFIKVRAENRAALIAYIPAGFPSKSGCAKVIQALANAGVDAIEIGFPYSDPVMDGPTIQEAADISLKGGTEAADVFAALKVASDTGVASVVMTYWNPIEKYGVSKFAEAISTNGGSGVITPDLTIEESSQWLMASSTHKINPIFVVAPSSSDERLAQVTSKTGGFVYAASVMGVTGARTTVSVDAKDLVNRVRSVTSLPVCVGLGVSTREQAKSVAGYSDGVIVGSAFIKLLLNSEDEASGLEAVSLLAKELALGVREGR